MSVSALGPTCIYSLPVTSMSVRLVWFRDHCKVMQQLVCYVIRKGLNMTAAMLDNVHDSQELP